MGEILAFAGRAKEAEKWIRKSMRLNPYHPPRYWTHLARSLIHQHRYDEALDALGVCSNDRLQLPEGRIVLGMLPLCRAVTLDDVTLTPAIVRKGNQLEIRGRQGMVVGKAR